jgi:hypothetical protein
MTTFKARDADGKVHDILAPNHQGATWIAERNDWKLDDEIDWGALEWENDDE